MGHIAWGDDYEFTKTYAGPRFPASTDPAGDRVGVEVRRAYLAHESSGLGSFRAGIQDWQDSFGQTLASSDWDFNVGGVQFKSEPAMDGGLDLRAGIHSLWEGDAADADDTYLTTFDLTYSTQAGDALGVGVYFLQDRGGYSYPLSAGYDDSWDLWAGVRWDARIGAMPFGAFSVTPSAVPSIHRSSSTLPSVETREMKPRPSDPKGSPLMFETR